jgi:two-component system chemotaxis response regulator CheY
MSVGIFSDFQVQACRQFGRGSFRVMREDLQVLVIDDQPSMQMLLSMSLRSMGIRGVSTAADGVEALDAMRRKTPDLVLLDMEMPRMGGLETLQAIREDEALRHLQVIVVTGLADAGVVKETQALGISGYLVKPLSAEALKSRIKTLTFPQRAVVEIDVEHP